MMNGIDLLVQLRKCKQKRADKSEEILSEVNRILHNNLHNEKNILNNLKHYNKSFELIDEEDVDKSQVFKQAEIRELALKYRLKFLDSQCYKYEFPYESVLKIEHLNSEHKKSLKGFKILGTHKFFKKEGNIDSALLFAPTNLGNYYLVHKWGNGLKWHRRFLSWPLKNIETLFATLIVITFIITMLLPTSLITLDRKATYWCAYRIGVFFHLFIFNMGVTAYITFAFSKNLSGSVWNVDKDFG